MSYTQYPERKRQITQRLRVALLICAAAAAAIPVIVYFATAEVMKRQEHLSERLISSAARSAELNAALITLADDTEKFGILDSADAVREASASVLSRIDVLQEGFGDEFQELNLGQDTQQISEQLSVYKVAISDVADNRIAQLASYNSIEKQRTIIHDLLRNANTVLFSEIASVNLELENRLSGADQITNADQSAMLVSDFQHLSLYQNLSLLLNDVEERVADVDTAVALENSDDIASQLRFLMRGVATRIAQVRNPDLRKSLARDVLALDLALLGPDGIISVFQAYLDQSETSERISAKQTGIAAQLLEYSDAVIVTTKADALQGSRNIADLVRDNRLAVLGLSSLLLLVLFALLFYVVGKKFTRRIRRLTDGVLAVAHGDVDHKIDIGGNDELTAMGDALEVFRENRLNLLKVNEELEIRNGEFLEVGTRLETILDTTTSGIIAFNHDRQIIMLNLPARHYLGGTSQQTPFALPENIDFLDSEDFSSLEASKNPILRALAGQNLTSEIALMQRTSEEEARYMRISSATVTQVTSPVRCVVVLEDVSEAEKNRQQVERAGRLDALGQLTGGIAHDFNNLLATIEYALELSIASGVNPQAEDYLKTAVGSVRRGSELTARLLSFAKRQPGLATSQNVSEIMRDFRGLVEPSIEENLTLKFEEVTPGLFVYCDGAQLENALLNLVLNSRDAILREGKGDRITISARELIEADTDFDHLKEQAEDAVHRGIAAGMKKPEKSKNSTRYIEFAVADNGPGMSAEVKRRAPDPFFTTKKTNSGTGLGLSMVYGFIQNSDGELRIYTEEGHGTTVRLLLPSGLSEGVRAGPVAGLPVSYGDNQLVLIVEDDVQLRQIMADLVASLGYSVQVSASGREALATFNEGFTCDAVLTDIVMPGGIGGFELGAELRALHPALPIVYMSGYSGFTEAEMGDAIGRFVQKPCAPSDLSYALADAIKNAPHL